MSWWGTSEIPDTIDVEKDVEKAEYDEESTANGLSLKSRVETEKAKEPAIKSVETDFVVTPNITIEREKIGKVPFVIDYDELMNLVPNLNEIPYCDTMPIMFVDHSTKPLFGMKLMMDELIHKELNSKLEERSPFYSSFERLTEKLTVDTNEPPKSIHATNYDKRLHKAMKLTGDRRIQDLMDLYNCEPIPIECGSGVDFKQKEEKYDNTKRFGDGMRFIFESLKKSSSDLYNHFLLEMLESNNISNASLNDEICLFSMRWDYAKVTLNSLKDVIKEFFPEKKSLETKAQTKPKQEEYRPETEKEVKVHDLIRFQTNVVVYENTKKAHERHKNHYYPMFLDETGFIAIEVVRDLLLYLTALLTAQKKSAEYEKEIMKQKKAEADSRPKKQGKALLKLRRIVKAVAAKVKAEALTSSEENIDPQDDKLRELTEKIKGRLVTLIDFMKAKDVLLTKSIVEDDHVELLLSHFWDDLVKSINDLNKEDMVYIAETRFGKTRKLHHSASYISRKYLYKLIRTAQSSLITYLTNSYVSLPSNWSNNVQMIKLKMDMLMDEAFIHHLKDNAMSILSRIGLKQIKAPNWGKRLYEVVESSNAHEIVSQLMALIKYKMLVGESARSPLYDKLVDDMQKYFTAIRSKTVPKEMESSFATESNIATETSSIIEKEILLRYIYLEPQLEYLQQVANIGADLVLDIGMKRSVRDL